MYPGVVEVVETTHAQSPDVQCHPCHCLNTLKTFYLCVWRVVRGLSAAWTFVFPLRETESDDRTCSKYQPVHSDDV